MIVSRQTESSIETHRNGLRKTSILLNRPQAAGLMWKPVTRLGQGSFHVRGVLQTQCSLEYASSRRKVPTLDVYEPHQLVDTCMLGP